MVILWGPKKAIHLQPSTQGEFGCWLEVWSGEFFLSKWKLRVLKDAEFPLCPYMNQDIYICLIYQPNMLCVLLLVCFEDLINIWHFSSSILQITSWKMVFSNNSQHPHKEITWHMAVLQCFPSHILLKHPVLQSHLAHHPSAIDWLQIGRRLTHLTSS